MQNLVLACKILYQLGEVKLVKLVRANMTSFTCVSFAGSSRVKVTRRDASRRTAVVCHVLHQDVSRETQTTFPFLRLSCFPEQERIDRGNSVRSRIRWSVDAQPSATAWRKTSGGTAYVNAYQFPAFPFTIEGWFIVRSSCTS